MAAQTQPTIQSQNTVQAIRTHAQPISERTAWHLPGVPVLIFDLLLGAAVVVAFWQASLHHGGTAVALTWLGAVLIVAAVLGFRGLTPVAPGRAQFDPALEGSPDHIAGAGRRPAQAPMPASRSSSAMACASSVIPILETKYGPLPAAFFTLTAASMMARAWVS